MAQQVDEQAYEARIEMAASTAQQIRQKVTRYRQIKDEKQALEFQSGIQALEEERKALREELKELAAEYREIVGENWSDEQGYCQFVDEGTSHKYGTETVDESTSGLRTRIAEMEDRLAVTPPVKEEDWAAWIEEIAPEANAAAKQLLVNNFKAMHEDRMAIARDISVILQGMEKELDKVDAARKTYTKRATVRIS